MGHRKKNKNEKRAKKSTITRRVPAMHENGNDAARVGLQAADGAHEAEKHVGVDLAAGQ